MASSTHTIAVFASDKGPGDPERASLMSQAGKLLAQKKVRIVCMAEGDVVSTPLVTSARTAGGAVTIVAGEGYVTPPALKGIDVERIEGQEERWQRMADLADGFLGLPGSLVTTNDMFNVWLLAGGSTSGKPVGLLNRNRAYEVMRGFSMDVLSHKVRNVEHLMTISDTLDDLWSRMQKVLSAGN